MFRINVIKYPTLSSISFAIFRSNFMDDNTICILDGTIFNYIKSGYRGGYVDVFKPYGKNVIVLDVYSLYPFVMFFYKMPVGQPIVFKGDILRYHPNIFNDENKYLFLKLEVECPNMDKPFLMKREDKNNYSTSIVPTGK